MGVPDHKIRGGEVGNRITLPVRHNDAQLNEPGGRAQRIGGLRDCRLVLRLGWRANPRVAEAAAQVWDGPRRIAQGDGRPGEHHGPKEGNRTSLGEMHRAPVTQRNFNRLDPTEECFVARLLRARRSLARHDPRYRASRIRMVHSST
jgi:hypothetical protein